MQHPNRSRSRGERAARLRSRRAALRRRLALAAGVTAFAVVAAAAAAALVGGAARADRAATRDGVPAQETAGDAGTGPVAAEAAAPASATTAPEEPLTTADAETAIVPTVTIAGVGDMLFDRNVKRLIEAEGGEAPLARVATRLAAADVTVGNLETTLATSGERNPVKEPKYAFRGHPDGVQGLRLAGFDAVSLANNHALDYGWPPLRDTIDRLESAGIAPAGAGEDTDAAWAPATVVTASGARVAYLAFTHVVPAGFLATQDRPGVASGKTDMDRIVAAVKRAKKSHDYVIVSFHWGVEYVDDANADQVRRARRVVDAGADMVLAHHPHVIQGVEFYKGRLIAYSLGDFVFDHYSRKTGEAFILEAELGPDGTPSALAVPVYLDEHGRPEFVRGEHAREILSRLKTISAKHGTRVRIDGDLGRLSP